MKIGYYPMKIFEKIKEFFRRIKIKKLQEAKVLNEVSIKTEKNEIDALNNVRNINNIESTKQQKLEIILKKIGCEQITINKILENENIDIDNLRKNIEAINRFKYSNIELSLIIANNIEILTMQNGNLNKSINIFMEYYNDTDIVKELIYANSKILNETGLANFNKVKEILNDYEISVIDDYNLLVDNPNIIFMKENRLKDSLTLLKKYSKTTENLKKLVKMEPIIIGITNNNLLLEYI